MKINMKFGIGVILTAMLLVSLVFVPAVSAQSGMPDKGQYVNSTNDVSIEDAEEVASYYVRYIPSFMENFQGWQEATVEQSEVYYDLDGKKSAYAFNVIENGQYAGYILVSATKDNYPILEFSKGKLPNAITELKATSESVAKEQASKNHLSIEKATPLYLGGTFYYMEYSLVNSKGNVVDKTLVDLTAPKTTKFNTSQIEELFDNKELLKQQQIRKEEAKEQWDSIESRMQDDSEEVVSTASLGWIDGVPAYEWRAGCSPTASAMVLGYWKDNGYSALPVGNTLIDELASEMGTYDWPANSTWPWDIDNGVEAVCDNHEYGSISASNDYSLSWSDTKSEIDNSRPFVLSMTYGGTGSGYTQEYGMHSVTCMGYSDSTEDYVFIHDTWDENTHHLAFGDWVAAMGTWVVP